MPHNHATFDSKHPTSAGRFRSEITMQSEKTVAWASGVRRSCPPNGPLLIINRPNDIARIETRTRSKSELLPRHAFFTISVNPKRSMNTTTRSTKFSAVGSFIRSIPNQSQSSVNRYRRSAQTESYMPFINPAYLETFSFVSSDTGPGSVSSLISLSEANNPVFIDPDAKISRNPVPM